MTVITNLKLLVALERVGNLTNQSQNLNQSQSHHSHTVVYFLLILPILLREVTLTFP